MPSDNTADREAQLEDSNLERLYGASYYLNYNVAGSPTPYTRTERWLPFFAGMADEIVRTLRPHRTFDAGCAIGMLVEALRDRGVQAWGVDFSEYAIANVRTDMRPYCRVRSITEPFEGRFDLVTCIEVLEHLREEDARTAVERMAAASDVVLFSSTPDGFEDPTHINIHPPDYWIELFGRHGLKPDKNYDASFVAPHAILFRRRGDNVGGKGHSSPLAADRIAEVEREASSARRRARQSETAASELKGNLEEILASPGWRLITRYRNWLRAKRIRHPRFFRWFEPKAGRLLRALTRRHRSADARAAPEAAIPTQYEDWIRLEEPALEVLNVQRRMSESLGWKPKFSIVIRGSDAAKSAVVESVRSQTYGAWEFCALDGEADGDYIVLLDPDAVLAPFALYEVAQRLNDDPSLDLIYSDEDRLAEDGKRRDPMFKPGWSPERLLSMNYVGPLCVLSAGLMRELGGWNGQARDPDWDLLLRAAARSNPVGHIPRILVHARCAPAAAIKRLEWKEPRGRTLAIVLSTGRAGEAAKYASAAFPASKRSDLEVAPVLCADAGTAELAARLNDAVRSSAAEAVVFCDETVQPLDSSCLDELTGPLSIPGVGIAGSKFFEKETCRVIHAGICFNPKGDLALPFTAGTDSAQDQYSNYLSVSGACFAIRRDVFDEVGGFSSGPRFPRLDVDLCLRVLLETGQRIVYNPYATMWKSGPAILERWIGDDPFNTGARCIRSSFPAGDPYFNSNLVCEEGRVGLWRFSAMRPLTPFDRDFAAEARALVKVYDCVPPEIAKSVESSSQCVAARNNQFVWFLHEFESAFARGVQTALRLADSFRRTHGVRSTFVIFGRAHPLCIRERIARLSPELAAAATVEVLSDYGGFSRLEPCDAAIATTWDTAYHLLRYNNAGRKFYLPDGCAPTASTSALAEATLDFGFHAICDSHTFPPTVGRDVFHSDAARDFDGARPYLVYCHAQPNLPGFELLIEAMRILKDRLRDRVTIVTAGADWDPADFGLEGLIVNLGPISYTSTGALYRSCDAGVFLTNAGHNCMLSLELMACGSLVVTDLHPASSWHLRNRDNCLLSVATPGALAATLEEGLSNPTLRRQVTEAAECEVRDQYQDWNASAETVFRYITSVLES